MKAPFLSKLGVSDIDQARGPTSDAFPYAFNVNNGGIWDNVLASMTFLKDSSLNWQQAINAYIDECVAQGAYPFSNLHQASNDAIIKELNDARKAVVRFLDRSRMTDLVSLKTTRREVVMTTFGFNLSVYGLATLKDPTFEQWLTQMPVPAFRLKHEGCYIKQLSAGLTMVVYNEGASLSQRWHVGYEIAVHRFPDLPGRHLPSKGELETFILDIMWMPILRSHRPLGFHHRLI